LAEQKNNREQQLREYTERLEQGIQDIFESGRYADYLTTLSRFHSYSARNTVLIHMQNPNATRVAGFSAWKKNFSRNVMKGEKGIKIFAPAPFTITKEMEKIDLDTQLPVLDENGNPVMEEVKTTIPAFKVVSVFDVSQTDGKPLPVLAENIEGDVAQYDLFRQALEQSTAYSVSYEPMADDTDGIANAETKHIRIREGMSEVQTVSALVHEMSHAELHNAEIPEGETYAERAARRNREEVEAESISFVVCQHFGIETDANSFGYIVNWSSDKELAELKASLDTIKKTASKMIDTIDARFSEIKQEHGIEQTVIEAEAVRVIPSQQSATAFAADYYNYMTAYNEANGLPPFGPETAIADIAGNIIDGNGIEDIRDTIQNTLVKFDELGIEDEDEAVTAAEGMNKDAETLLRRLHGFEKIEYIMPEQAAPTAPDLEENNNPQNEAASAKPTDLQQKGLEIARRYEKLPLQDRINIIAETFGCKTASIRTTPCTGKWRGTSDIHLDLDNGSSLFIGNDRTPQAKTARVQNECVNGTLANYNPEIVSETKARAMAILPKREAADNAIAAERGLKPYTFLNVELNDGSIEKSGGYMGWYYVTLAVDGKIFAFTETGLNSDISGGRLSENPTRPNYFVAGALKETDVDFVFNNVGHSSTRELYTQHLSDEIRGRAETRLKERLAANLPDIQSNTPEQGTPEKLAQDLTEQLPDPGIGLSERDLYGYTSPDMLPLLKERALELYDEDHTIYLLNSDGTELMALSQTEIRQHPGIFGIEADEWQAALEYRKAQAAVKDGEAAQETELLRDAGDRYGIYQIEDIRNTKYAYRPFEQAGTDFNRTDYKLMYTAQLDPNTTLENLFTLHNRDNRPGGDKMRSMSLSDIVVMKRDGQVSAHYVDTSGFQPVPQFLESHIKTAEMSTEQNYNMIDGIPNNTAPELVEIHSAVHSNYEGMTALISANDNAVYLGRSENYDNNGHYDNSDHSLTFITHNPIVFPLLYGEGFIMSQDKMLKEGAFSIDTYEEWAALQAGVLAQFTPAREILFDGQPFKAPDHAPTVAELEADVKAGESISLLDLANAVKNERKTEMQGKKPSVLGQLKQGKKEVAQNKEKQKNAPKRDNGLEV